MSWRSGSGNSGLRTAGRKASIHYEWHPGRLQRHHARSHHTPGQIVRAVVSTTPAARRTLARSIAVRTPNFASIRRAAPAPPGARPMADVTEQLAATLADRYRIERRLGEGGM